MSFIIYWCILRYKISHCLRVQSLGRLAGRSQLWVKQAEGLYFWWHKQNVSTFDETIRKSLKKKNKKKNCETSRMSLFLAKQAEGLYFWNRENSLYFWWNKQKSLLFVKRQKVSTLMKQPESQNQPESLYFCWNRQKVCTFVLLFYFRLTAQFWANTGRHYRGRVACHGRSGPCITECWLHQRLLTWRIAFTDIDS